MLKVLINIIIFYKRLFRKYTAHPKFLSKNIIGTKFKKGHGQYI